MKSTQRSIALRIMAFLLLAVAMFEFGDRALGQTVETDLTATASFKPDEPISPETAIEITLSRSLKTNEKIAVMIAHTDVSNLFAGSETRFAYNANLLPLPVGKSELTIYVVSSGGNWTEIARLTMVVNVSVVEKKAEAETVPKADETVPAIDETKKADEPVPAATQTLDPVATPTGTKPQETKGEEPKPAETNPAETKPEETKTEATPSETPEAEKTEPTPAETPQPAKKRFFKVLPAFTLAIPSQPFQTNFPIETRPEKRATFTDFDLTASIKTEGKVGILSTESSFDFAGSSFKEKTLQFGTLGNKAPDVDLSSYLTNIQVGKAKFSLGHTSFGANRHLVSSFSSRGLSMSIPINKRFDITAGILNGTSVLGVRNFVGISNVRHQMQGATLGIEFFPKRPGAMRLEVSGFNGYLQALNNVSEGRIVDAEQSRGIGLRFVTVDKSDRFRLEFGFARSRFFNPEDKTLDPDGNAVPLAPVTRWAHYIETTYQALKDLKLTKTKSLNLSLGFRYEFVEPLYRSLGASASADKFSKDITVDASIGEITFQVAHARSNDNLREVPSILKSLIRSNRFSAAIPLKVLFGDATKPSPFLPRLGYSIDRTNNFGAGIPVNGGFEIDPATIPDLVNINQTFSAGWQFAKFNFDYSYNRSFADNRQTGSERNDQLGWVHSTTFTINPLEILSFNLGFSFDSQRNFGLGTLNQTKSMNFGANWKPFKNATLALEASQALSGDLARTSRNRNINYSSQFAYSISHEKSRFKKVGMQVFMRFADAYVRTRDLTTPSNELTRTKILTAGMTVNFF